MSRNGMMAPHEGLTVDSPKDKATAAPAAHFSADDTEQFADYHSVSALAIIGLVLGLAAPLAFLAPLLIAVPILGAVISLLAIARIDASEGALVGRTAAAIGLALSVVFGVATFSRSWVAQYGHVHQADAAARQWIGLLQAGEPRQAFELTSDAVRARDHGDHDHDAPPGHQHDYYHNFVEQPVVQKLISSGQGVSVRFDRTLHYQAMSHGRNAVQLRYVAAPVEQSSDESWAFAISLHRSPPAGLSPAQWRIVASELDTADVVQN